MTDAMKTSEHSDEEQGNYHILTYSLFDPKDCVWLGDEEGPFIYDDWMLTRVAATVWTERLDTLIEPREYDSAPEKIRDRVTPLMTGLEAIQRLEGVKES